MKNKSPLKSCIVTLGIVFALPGIILVIVAAVMGLNILYFVQTAERADGTVIKLAENPNLQGVLMYSPVVEFTDHRGQRHEYQPNLKSDPPLHAVGDKVQILYERDRPASAGINQWFQLYFIPLLLLILATVNIVIVTGLCAVALLISRLVGNHGNSAAEPTPL